LIPTGLFALLTSCQLRQLQSFQLISTLLPSGLNAATRSCSHVTSQIAAHAGLTVPLRPLMTGTALQLLPQAVDKDSRVFYRPLILLAAAVKTTASPSTAMVVRSPLLGDGSRLTVSFLEVDTATLHTAMPTLCLSVHITSLPQLSSLATRSQLSLQLAQSHARPTLLLPTKLTRSKPFPTTALVVKSTLSSKTS